MSGVDALINTMQAEAQKAVGTRAAAKKGIVTGYDSTNYCAKVKLMPEGTETGWLPIGSDWVGNGWGLFAPPSIDDMVQVEFDEGDHQSGSITKRFFNDEDRPLAVDAGEFWLVHKSGSLLKFTNDGDVIVVSDRDLLANVGRNLTAIVTGDASVTATGKVLLSSESEVDAGNLGSAVTKLVKEAFMALFNSHTHPVVAGVAVATTQQMNSSHMTTTLKGN